MIFGAILAGGTGSRMKIDSMPKQFLPLGEAPVFIHTIQKFVMAPRINHVYLGVHPDWKNHAVDILAKFGLQDSVKVVAGGADRNQTISNIIASIQSKFGADEDHVIITHDAVRPFVSMRIIEENIKAALEVGACDTVIPATDTIVEALDSQTISNIPQRKYLYQGQTPQSFKLSVLRNSFESLSDADRSELTDACKAAVLAGLPVKLVEGSPTNIKLTTVMDYRIAQALLNQLPEE